MGDRYYNPNIKRFINQDVVNGSITNSQSLNKFSYVQGNPIKLTDPFGLFPCISLSGIGHAALSLLGIVPGLDFCDAINAAWYLAEGDYTNATISMVAALPFLGSVAGTGIKWGMKAGTKATKVAETVKLGSRIAGGAGGFIISGAQALEAVKNIHANSGENGDKSGWSNAGDFLTLGLSIAGMGMAGASIAKSGEALNGLWKGQDVVEVAAVSNATGRVASESGKNTKNTNNDKVLITGEDWNAYFREQYGYDNVNWDTAFTSPNDIADMPSSVARMNPDGLNWYLNQNGINTTPLGKGHLKGVPYESGGGFNAHYNSNYGSTYVQFHPGDGYHGDGAYYKVSSGNEFSYSGKRTGTQRFRLNGRVMKYNE